MCLDSSFSLFEKKNEIGRSHLFLLLIVRTKTFAYTIWWCICPFLFSDENLDWTRLFCVKTIFTPHLFRSSIGSYWKTYHLHDDKETLSRLMTGGNYCQGHPVNEHTKENNNNCLFILSWLPSWHQHRYDMKLKAIISERRSKMGGDTLTIKAKRMLKNKNWKSNESRKTIKSE